MEHSPARGEDLSDLERALIDSVANGMELDLAVAEPVDEAAMKAWGESKTGRASAIRDVLRGRHAGGAGATTTSGAGNSITISNWVLQLTAWSLATLFIAAFTGAVRKT